MLRTVFLSLIVVVCFSSATLIRKSLSRRQADEHPCQAIDGFDCTCSSYRVSCTSDRELPQSLSVSPQEREKHSSVELVIKAARDQNVYEHTFEPVKQLFKSDAHILEFRVKFESFTSLSLPAGIFNRVFPENTPATTQKYLSLEIYNNAVQPNDNVNLFANLNADQLQLSVLYPFRGTFQQLFAGANIKYLRLSGEVHSDPSQPFTGNIGRLELARQATQLTTQIFPTYPAHELVIDAFYVSDFSSDNPPNYSNLGELRVHSQEQIPANAFRNFPNLQALTIAAEKGLDPHALDGLHKLEKLTVKETKPSLELLNSLPNLKEFETDLEKFDEREQCQLAEKTANGQLVVQPLQSGYQCTCASAYLNSASGRYACDAQNCDQSSCAAIKNNYDASTRTFKAPPAIRRADGSDAFRQRESKVHSGPYQVSNQDQDKSQQNPVAEGNEQNNDDGQNQGTHEHHHHHPDANNQGEPAQAQEGNENPDDAGQNSRDGEGNENRQQGDEQANNVPADQNQSSDAVTGDVTDVPPSTKRKLGWLPIIIIIAAVAGLLLIGLIILLVRRRRAAAGYNPTATSEHGGAQTARA